MIIDAMVVPVKSKKPQVSHEARDRFGPLGRPIPASRVFRAPFTRFNDPTIRAEKWVLVNERNNTVIFANSYDGRLGPKYNLEVNTRPLTGVNAKKHAQRTKPGGEYEEVDVSQCPFAIRI